jgi:hypothetical protein
MNYQSVVYQRQNAAVQNNFRKVLNIFDHELSLASAGHTISAVSL